MPCGRAEDVGPLFDDEGDQRIVQPLQYWLERSVQVHIEKNTEYAAFSIMV